MWNLVWLKHTLSETKNCFQVLCRFNFTRHWSAEYSLIGGMFTNEHVCRFVRYMGGIGMEDFVLRSFTVGMWQWLGFDSQDMGLCVETCCEKWSRNESLLAALMQQCVLAQLLL